MAVVIDAIEHMLRRGLPADVIKKFLERSEEELDPSTTVVYETLLLRIRATLLCGFVGFVLGGFLAAD